MKFSLPQRPWNDQGWMEIDLPDDWQVQFCPMNGYDRAPLTGDEMMARIEHPIGTPPLLELARGRKRAVIVFDDMTRPTRTYELAPLVLKILHEAGLNEDQITFVCALGTHGALTMIDFRKKLGSGIIEKYRVFNHNIYENCVEVGTTRRGTRVMFNREVMEADLKIAIGCVTAHVQAGFSGGGKLFLPGVAHIDTISHYHLKVEKMGKETTGMGCHENNILRQEINEAASMAKVDFLLNVVVNGKGETTGLYAGELYQAHDAAVKEAKTIYATEPIPQEKDLVIANAFSKPNEMGIAIVLGASALKGYEGTVVVIADSPEGQVPHYLLGRFGRDYGGRQYPVAEIPPGVNLIIMTPYPDRTLLDWFGNPEAATIARNWEEVMEMIRPRHGKGTKVTVLPNATMQYFPKQDVS
jgi:nickel-dependent lactate racemase